MLEEEGHVVTADGPPAGRSVLAYDQELVPWLFEHWAEPLIDLVAPGRSSSILDLACGSGLVVRHLVDRLDSNGTIHGVDVDPEMLSYAAATVDDPRVSWHEADAGLLPFDDDSFDIICCHQGLQFFLDPVAALTEARRVLHSSGRLVIAVWGPLIDNPWPAALANAIRCLLGDTEGDSMLTVCRLGDPDDLAAILDQAGLHNRTIQQRKSTANHPDIVRAINGQLSAMPSGSTVGDLDRNQRSKLADKMRDLLADNTSSTGELSVTSTCLLAIATNPSL